MNRYIVVNPDETLEEAKVWEDGWGENRIYHSNLEDAHKEALVTAYDCEEAIYGSEFAEDETGSNFPYQIFDNKDVLVFNGWVDTSNAKRYTE